MLGSFLALDLVLFFAFFEVALIPMWFVITGGADPARRARPAACRDPLPGLHGARVGADAGRLPASCGRRPARSTSSRSPRPTEPSGGRRHRRRAGRARPRRQDAAVAAAHLAARRALQGADRRVGGARRRAAQARHLRAAALLAAVGRPVVASGCGRWSPGSRWSGIVYAALACLAQTDLKRLIAYSSVGHMGFVVLAATTSTVGGVQAAVYASVAHGLITGLLFFLAGAVKDRYGTGDLGRAQRALRLGAAAGRRCSRSRRWPRSGCPGWPGSGARCWRSARRVYPAGALPRDDVRRARGDRGPRRHPHVGVLPGWCAPPPGRAGRRTPGQEGVPSIELATSEVDPGTSMAGALRRTSTRGVGGLVAAGRAHAGARRRAGLLLAPVGERRARSSGACVRRRPGHRLARGRAATGAGGRGGRGAARRRAPGRREPAGPHCCRRR